MSMPRPYIVKVDLDDKLKRYERGILLATADGFADRFGAEVMRGGKAADLSSYTVKGYFKRPDGVTITIDGTIDGNKALVLLRPDCYYYDGGFEMAVKLHGSGNYSHTLAIFCGEISETVTGAVIDGGNVFSPADAVLRRINHNLLDNGDFTQPINQRGKTTYSGAGYTIDRWYQSNAYASTTIGNKYVLFKANGGTAYPRQYIMPNAGMYGKMYTVAVCTNGGFVTAASGVLTEDAVTSETTIASATVAAGVTLRLTKSPSGLLSVRLDIADGNNIALRWAALYEGSYTKDNLPPYQYKGYAAELLECQRYCFVLSQYACYSCAVCGTNTILTSVPTPTRMRSAPSIESGTLLILSANGTTQSGFTFSAGTIGNNFLRVEAAKIAQGLTAAALRADTDVVFSADLK